MSDYELQFQAELERAQALSLESLALEQYRRQRSTSQDPAIIVDDDAVTLRRRRDGVESEPPPALPPPPRRAPRPPRASAGDPPPARSAHASPTRNNHDLISFTSPKQSDAHASLKEYIGHIHKLGEKTPEMSANPNNNTNPPNPPPNQPYFNQNPPYAFPSPYYNYQYQYGGHPPPPPQYSPATPQPYGMSAPMPGYPYYAPRPATPDQNSTQPNRPNSAPYPVAVPAVPYNHTRMSSPGYTGYPPPRPQTQPQYNFTTTNLISRPTRPAMPSTSPSIYPQLNQLPSYQQPPGQASGSAATPSTPSSSFQSYPKPTPTPVQSMPVAQEESNSSRPDFSRKLSETSIASNESNDTVGSLPRSINLIDFTGRKGANSQGSVRVSVLEAFDPLLIEQNNAEYMGTSECSGSVYDEFDPLDFLYGEAEARDTPVYVSVNKRESVAASLPSPPPKSLPTVPAVTERSTTHKLYDCIVKTRSKNYDSEHKGFLNMVLDVRKQFKYNNSKTNPGYVIAARSGGKYPANTSIKILVHHLRSEEPITFTSDVESTVEHIILHVVCTLEEEIKEDMSQFMLRVWGVNEYLTPGSSLSEYDYIRQCVRLEKDVRLCLTISKDDSLARTEVDDNRDGHLTLDDLIPNQGMAPTLNYDNLSILLETLEGELSRAVGMVGAEGSCTPNAVVQAVKAICALAGCLETLHLTYTLSAFIQACSAQGSSGSVRPEIVSDSGQYSSVSLRSATPREAVSQQCARLRDAVRSLLQLYTRTQALHFQLADTQFLQPRDPDKAVLAHTVSETALFCIEAVHRLPPCWKHDDYLFQVQIYHGTRPLKGPHLTGSYSVENTGFYPRILFDTWLNLEDQMISSLPREARLVLTLYGRTARTADTPHAPEKEEPTQDENAPAVQVEQEELGWTAIQLFAYDGMLVSGNYILPIWPTCTDKRLGPAPHPFHSPAGQHASVNIEVPLYAHTGVRWSSESNEDGSEESSKRKELPAFESLDAHTQSQLIHLVEKGAYQRMPPDCREILWEKRQYLVQIPGALPLVLLAATNWYGAHRAQLISLLRHWEPPSALNAMHLLLPCFPDSGVREMATRIVASMSDDTMSAVLPQLVQALRHETYHDSQLARLLLRRALLSPAIAHRLYWLLVHSLPGAVSQNSNEEFLGISLEEGARGAVGEDAEGGGGAAWRWAHRYQLLLRALLATCGESLARRLRRQQLLVKGLSDAAHSVKAAKDGAKQRALTSCVEQLCTLLRQSKISLPLSLSQEVHNIDVKSCTYFNSNTLPLKINFIGNDNAVVPAMFKVGDDLRQDALVLQVMRVMDSLWLKEGLDLRMVTFQAIPTQHRKGMIEIVSEAETLRAIQTEWGLTGSFKDRPIAEWLAKHNPSELEYERARDNFTASCAGYSVATYLLGICDRHNDNIMLKTSGHLFHIDFGKFLGDAQMFANFKRDRAPFVLTSDMAYVINGGERPSQRFHYFVELCCMAFNIVRAHHNHILDLFALMATSGVPGVSMGAVTYVRGALLPGATQAEAAAAFARLIHSSLKSKFTPINFFLHNLAQLRASGDQNSASSELLSFMPRTYTMAQEGRLVSVEVLGYEKRYDPEKHYVYSLRIYRQGQATPFVLYRSYKHFTELYQKICLHFPLAKVHSLPMGLHVGRSNTRQVAERRFNDVQAFLTSLFGLADEIAHSDLVYTFFHPLLRDQQDAAPQRLKHKVSDNREAENSGSGSIKISVQYTANVLSVLILHAQSLALTPQGLPPNPYVKVYLVPDPTKETKRKTRVLKRNSHPSFMEMLEYRMPIDVVRSRTLQATVWNYDSLQENQFLGGVLVPLHSLPLRQETVGWYPLEYIPR